MPNINSTTDRLELPRPLINRLLHAAQSMPDEVHWGLIGADGEIPTHCYPIRQLESGQVAAIHQKLEQHGETLFAIYRSDPDRAPMPDISELGAFDLSAPYLLGISLGTKGVLQLRGWRIADGQLTALDVGISAS